MMDLALPVYVPSFLFGLSDGLVLPIVPLFARALAHSDALVGLTSAAGSIGKLVADVPAGGSHAAIFSNS